MTLHSITLQLPERIYLRLQQVAQATQQSLDDVFLRVLQIGSPPSWEDVPAEFQADLAALDRLDDAALWRVARSKQVQDMNLYQTLLDKNANNSLNESERQTLTNLRREADRFMLRKAQSVALLRWRGHQIPPANKL